MIYQLLQQCSVSAIEIFDYICLVNINRNLFVTMFIFYKYRLPLTLPFFIELKQSEYF